MNYFSKLLYFIIFLFFFSLTGMIHSAPLPPINLSATYSDINNNVSLDWYAQTQVTLHADAIVEYTGTSESPTEIHNEVMWRKFGDGTWNPGTFSGTSVLEQTYNSERMTYYIKEDLFNDGDMQAYDAVDYDFEYMMYSTGPDNDMIGIMFRYQDDQHYYLFEIWSTSGWGTHSNGGNCADSPAGRDYSRIVRVNGFEYDVCYSTGTTYHDQNWEHPDYYELPNNINGGQNIDTAYDFSTWYKIKLKATGSNFKIYVKKNASPGDNIEDPGYLWYDVDDTTFSHGTFGFVNHSQHTVYYYNILYVIDTISYNDVVSSSTPVIANIDETQSQLLPLTMSSYLWSDISSWCDTNGYGTNCTNVTVNYTATFDHTSAYDSIISSDGGATSDATNGDSLLYGNIATGELSFYVLRDTVDPPVTEEIGPLWSTTQVVDNLDCTNLENQTYYYGVKAEFDDPVGRSTLSNVDNITTKSFQPTEIVVVNPDPSATHSLCGTLPVSGTYTMDDCLTATTVEYRIDGGTWTGVPTLSGTSSGNWSDNTVQAVNYLNGHSIEARLVNSRGTSYISPAVNFFVSPSSVTPNAVVLNPAASSSFSNCGTISLNGTFSVDNCLTVSTVRYAIDGTGWTGVSNAVSGTSGTWTVTSGIDLDVLGLPNGVHTIVVEVTDSLSGTGQGAVREFELTDLDPPVAQFIYPEDGNDYTPCGNIVLTGSFETDTCISMSTISYRVDGGTWVNIPAFDGGSNGYWTYATGADFSGLSNGSHTIELQPLDTNGVSSTSFIEIEITNNVSPEITIVEPIQDSVYAKCGSTPVSGTFQADPCSGVDTIQYRLDSGAWLGVTTINGASSGNWEGNDLTLSSSVVDGLHTIDVMITNQGGSTSSNYVTFTSSSANLIPDVLITSPIDGTFGPCTYEIPISGTYFANACPTVDVTIQYRVDGTSQWIDASTTGSDTWTGTPLTRSLIDLEGGMVHTIMVNIADSHGNSENTIHDIYISDDAPTFNLPNNLVVTTIPYTFDYRYYIGGPSGIDVTSSVASVNYPTAVTQISDFVVELSYPETATADQLTFIATDCQPMSGSGSLDVYISLDGTGPEYDDGLFVGISSIQPENDTYNTTTQNVPFIYFDVINYLSEKAITEFTFGADDIIDAFGSTSSTLGLLLDGNEEYIGQMTLYSDVNMDGAVDSGDISIGSATFTQDDGIITITPDTPYNVAINSTQKMLLVADQLEYVIHNPDMAYNLIKTDNDMLYFALTGLMIGVLFLLIRRRLKKAISHLMLFMLFVVSLTFMVNCFSGEPVPDEGSYVTTSTTLTIIEGNPAYQYRLNIPQGGVKFYETSSPSNVKSTPNYSPQINGVLINVIENDNN